MNSATASKSASTATVNGDFVGVAHRGGRAGRA
eukprot:CAMPEP_0173085954 /NCGR_PEP_ID=MMETSP1102-20130122/22270_1 /TAXON_ID=49646 /ORGANISM="Geminigera sp., Strain Caron Lab Isolate" /LENGTH=32 /DNA_ID= /DNA_START= /DNA_END= /DNA_ORIENTATION=